MRTRRRRIRIGTLQQNNATLMEIARERGIDTAQVKHLTPGEVLRVLLAIKEGKRDRRT